MSHMLKSGSPFYFMLINRLHFNIWRLVPRGASICDCDYDSPRKDPLSRFGCA